MKIRTVEKCHECRNFMWQECDDGDCTITGKIVYPDSIPSYCPLPTYDTIRAEARAEALKDAADRAVEFLKGWDVGQYLGYDDLRAAITQEGE